LLKTQE